MKLSVIVPVYKVEKYLKKCLNSLLKQDFDDYEIIVVNDGSPDNCQEIIDCFVKLYPNVVKGFIKENGGLSDARNYGIDKASGEYIIFVDSDDYLEEGYFNQAFKEIEKHNYDVLISDVYYVYDNSLKNFISKGFYPSDDVMKSAILAPNFVGNKIYHSKFFKKLNIRFPLGLWDEDTPVYEEIILNAENIGYLPIKSLNYYQREGSILHTFDNPKIFDIFQIMDLTTGIFKKLDKFEKYHDEIEYMVIENLIYYGGFRFLRSKYRKELILKASNYMKANFPNYRKNPYLKNLKLKNRVFVYTITPLTVAFWRIFIK